MVNESTNWLQIQTVCDGYQGWVERAAICKLDGLFAIEAFVSVCRQAAHLYAVEDTIYGPIMTLPFESRLQLMAPVKEGYRWLQVRLPDQRTAYIQRGDVQFDERKLTRREMCQFSLQFQGLPYTWGGRSSFGYDCSGFVQMLYRQMGILLPRDARQQIHWAGFKPGQRSDLTAGDLLFFGPEESRIQHVGLSLGDGQFIHATVAENAPYIRISDSSTWDGTGKYRFSAARLLSVSA